LKEKLKALLYNLSKKSRLFKRFVDFGKYMVGFLRYKKSCLFNKVDDKTVLFEAFQGRMFACSPKALFFEMISNDKYKDYKKICVVRDLEKYKDLEENPNTKLVKFGSKAYFNAYAKSRYWITNFRLRAFLKEGKKHKYIQTWHGTPLKRLGCDISVGGNATSSLSDIEREYKAEAKRISAFLSPSAFCTEKFMSAFRLKKETVVENGYPRNEALFTYTDKDVLDYKKRLGLPLDKKVILYAPTFRDNQHDNKLGYVLKLGMDFDSFKEKFGSDSIVLFRAHYFVANAFDFEKYKGFVFNVSDYEDINHLYIISDLLITDYSSVFFDYANLKRPIVYYMYDIDDYKNNMRDFYIDIDTLPGNIVSTQKELEDDVYDKLNNFTYDDKYKKFNEKYNYLDGIGVSKKFLEQVIN